MSEGPDSRLCLLFGQVMSHWSTNLRTFATRSKRNQVGTAPGASRPSEPLVGSSIRAKDRGGLDSCHASCVIRRLITCRAGRASRVGRQRLSGLLGRFSAIATFPLRHDVWLQRTGFSKIRSVGGAGTTRWTDHTKAVTVEECIVLDIQVFRVITKGEQP